MVRGTTTTYSNFADVIYCVWNSFMHVTRCVIAQNSPSHTQLLSNPLLCKCCIPCCCYNQELIIRAVKCRFNKFFFYNKNFLSQSSYIIFYMSFYIPTCEADYITYVFFFVILFQVVFARWIDGYFLTEVTDLEVAEKILNKMRGKLNSKMQEWMPMRLFTDRLNFCSFAGTVWPHRGQVSLREPVVLPLFS